MRNAFLMILRLGAASALGGLWCSAASGQGLPPTAAALQDALLAQVLGFGGCLELERVDTVIPQFFPTARILQGSCEAEHGDTLLPRAAADDLGLVYVLDSPSGFAFLIRRHHPVAIDSANALEYGHEVLHMTGDLTIPSRLITGQGDLPQELRADLARRGVTALSEISEDRAGRFRLWMVVLTGSRLSAFNVLVDRGTGGAIVLSETVLWQGRRQR